MLTSNGIVRQTCLRNFWVGLTLAIVLLASAQGSDISGKWALSVALEDGSHGDPTFVLKQQSGKLTGTYNGPLGEKEVAGTVSGDTAHFGWLFRGAGW